MAVDVKSLVKEILDGGYVMSLATADDDGVWASDVIFVHDDDFNIYWMSNVNVRHSKALAQNPQAAGTITLSGRGENSRGIQFAGAAEKVESIGAGLLVRYFLKRGIPLPKEGEMTEGESWYVIKPKKIDVIDEKLFGYGKQKIEL